MKTPTRVIVTVLSLFFLASCTKRDVRQDEPLITTDDGSSQSDLAGSSESVPSSSVSTGNAGDVGRAAADLETVYFAFDSYRLDETARDILKRNADWLKAHPSAQIQIEGHCDERGTTEYNLALGERRANAVRSYLKRIGVAISRLSIISYGEERPEDVGHSESAWANNRRAVPVIIAR